MRRAQGVRFILRDNGPRRRMGARGWEAERGVLEYCCAGHDFGEEGCGDGAGEGQVVAVRCGGCEGGTGKADGAMGERVDSIRWYLVGCWGLSVIW